MHTQRTIMLIVLAVFLAGIAAVVGVIWSLGLGLYPRDGGVTRLVSPWRPKLEKTNPAAAFFAAIAGPGSFIMEQKMLRGIRDRAERTAERRRNGSGEAR